MGDLVLFSSHSDSRIDLPLVDHLFSFLVLFNDDFSHLHLSRNSISLKIDFLGISISGKIEFGGDLETLLFIFFLLSRCLGLPGSLSLVQPSSQTDHPSKNLILLSL